MAGYFNPGFSGNILTTVVHDGSIHIGGWFSSYNEHILTSGVARFDPGSNRWVELGTAFRSLVTRQTSAFHVHNGQLYAGIASRLADLMGESSNVVLWTGTDWQPVGDALPFTPSAFATYKGDLYAASGNTLYKLSAGNWTSTGVSFDGNIASLLVDGEDLLIGGAFTRANLSSVMPTTLFTGLYRFTQERPSLGTGVFNDGWVFNNAQTFDAQITLNSQGRRQFSARHLPTYNGDLLAFPLEFLDVGGVRRVVLQSNVTTNLQCGQSQIVLGVPSDTLSSGFDPTNDTTFRLGVRDNATRVCDRPADDIVFTVTRVPMKSIGDGLEAANTIVRRVNRVVRWNGTDHPQSVGIGVAPNTNEAVLSMVSWDGTVVKAGTFTTYDGFPMQRIAKLDRTTGEWVPMGAGFASGLARVLVHDGHLYAFGEFNMATSGLPVRFARWTGSGWIGVGSAQDHTSVITALSHDGALYAALGNANNGDIVRWVRLDGNAWTDVLPVDEDAIGSVGQASSLAFLGDDMYSGGNTFRLGLTRVNRLGRYTPSAGWQPVGSGVNQFVRKMRVFDGDVILAGDFTQFNDGTPANRVARIRNGVLMPMADGLNSSVWDLVVHNGGLYAVGPFTASGSAQVLRVAHWSGNAWVSMGQGLTGVGLSIVPFQGSLHVGGANIMSDGSNAASWDGQKWVSITPILHPGTQTPATIRALAVHNGLLYAGASVGTGLNHQIFRLRPDRSGWDPVGDVFNQVTLSMVSHQGRLYVAGFFNAIGSSAIDGLAVLDEVNNRFERLGDGLNRGATVNNLYSDVDGVWFAGGGIRSSGSLALTNFGKWVTGTGVDIPESEPGTPKATRLGEAYPNPFNPSTVIRFTLDTGRQTRLAVYDLLGREVAVLVDGVMPAGHHQTRFDATGLGSGVYLVRMTAGTQSFTRKVVLVR